MNNLHILITRHYDLDSSHFTNIWLDSILPELSKFFIVKITWFCYYYEKSPISSKETDDEIIQIQEFDNAMDVIEKIKPDLIIDNEFPTLIDLAFFVASRNNVAFIRKWKNVREIKASFKNTVLGFNSIFDSNVYADKNDNNKFMKRGRFFLRKYIFFINTIMKSKISFSEKLTFFLISIKWHLRPDDPFTHPKLQSDLELLNAEWLVPFLTKRGYVNTKLVVTGLPDLDSIIKKTKMNSSVKSEKRLKILFAPTQIYEGKIYEKIKHETIKNIIQKITQHKNQFTLSVKLHPTSQNFEEYQKIIHEIDDSIEIFQKGDLEKFVIESDLVISYGFTSAFVYPFVAKKPVILCNFYDMEFVDNFEDILFYCKNPDKLVETVLIAHQTNFEKYDSIGKYLEQCNYKFDGLSSMRIVNAIKQLILQKK